MSALVRTQDEFLKAQGKAGPHKLVILMFYVDWSGVCAQLFSAYRGMAETYGRPEKEDDEDSVRCVFLRADVDDADPELVRGIYALPTFRFYRGGLPMDTLYTPDHAQLERRIRKHSNGIIIATSTKGKAKIKGPTSGEARNPTSGIEENRMVLA